MAKLFQAQYPASRSRREVWLAVLLAHVLALWLINLYWPVQRIAQQVVVQIFRSSSPIAPDAKAKIDNPQQTAPATPAQAAAVQAVPDAQTQAQTRRLGNTQRGITAQRRLKASPELSLPTLVAEQSTPLQTTAQLPALRPSRKRSGAVAAKVETPREAAASLAPLDTPIRVREEPIVEAAGSVPAAAPAPILAPAPAPVPSPSPIPTPAPAPSPIRVVPPPAPVPPPPAPVPSSPVPPPPAPAPPPPVTVPQPPAPQPPEPAPRPVIATTPAPAPTPTPTPTPAPSPAPVVAAPTPTPTPTSSPAPATASSPSLSSAPASSPVASPASPARAPATASSTGETPSTPSAASRPGIASSATGSTTTPSGALAGSTQGVAAGATQGATTGSTSGSAIGGPAGSATGAPTGSATGASTGAASNANLPTPRPPLDLRLPPAARPTFPYTPPNAQPRRSISEMANEQLRRDRPGKLEEGIDSAKNLDCTKDATAQGGENKINETNTAGLMNIFSLAKRTFEGKCAK